MKKNIASEWIQTDLNAVTKDITRLGLDGAVEYQMDLINDRKASGDDRWDCITAEEMRAELKEIAERNIP